MCRHRSTLEQEVNGSVGPVPKLTGIVACKGLLTHSFAALIQPSFWDHYKELLSLLYLSTTLSSPNSIFVVELFSHKMNYVPQPFFG